jgi:hypothetical protein
MGIKACPECGSDWSESKTCHDHFNQLLFWELENLVLFQQAHHLSVLSYHLQHPSLYSPEGLSWAIKLLIDYYESDVHPRDSLSRERDNLDSGKRDFKFLGKPGRHGVYQNPVVWSMTIFDVVGSGKENYVSSVNAWAASIYFSLAQSKNLNIGAL